MAEIEIAIPPSREVATGNRYTAQAWAEILSGLGHKVNIREEGDGFCGELLIAVNAVKCRAAIEGYRARRPDGVVVVCLSGTDINEDGGEVLRASMADADRLVILQEQALKRVPAEFHAKTRVIVQGVTPSAGPVVKDHDERFVVCVVGHLRDVKDPLRAAYASRLLEEDSRIEVRQAGSILEENYVELVKEEQEMNPRYRWLGELSSEEVRRLIVESDLMVISSRSEGGPRVVGEAVVEGTPILSSRIDGVRGLLGADYPGYFPVGDTEALAELLAKVESDASFREDLRLGIEKVAPLFDPRREKEAWETMLRGLGVS